MRSNAILKSFIMSYIYKNKVYSITSPVISISVNKLNIVVTDQTGSQLITFPNINDSKKFLAFLYKA